MPSRRMEKVASLLLEEIGQIVTQELSDPDIGFVTVTAVEPAADLSYARVMVSILGEEAAQAKSMRALNKATSRVQFLVGERVTLRKYPKLQFVLDQGVKRSIRVSALLDDLARERGERESGEYTEGECLQ